MTEAEALELLRRYNRWRRYEPDDPFSPPKESDPKMPDPKQIGIAIDVACIALSEFGTALSVLRVIATGDNRTRRKNLARSCIGLIDSMRTSN